MTRFEPDRYYLTTDPELELLGTRDTLAKQRHFGVGPRYHKLGKRVLYLGSDLNAYLDSCAVDPVRDSAQPDPGELESEAPDDAEAGAAVAA